MKRKTPEASLQKCIVQMLKLFGSDNMLFFSIPNERKAAARTIYELKLMGMRPGAADLCLIIGGKASFIECKSKKGTQTLEQIQFQEDCNSKGIPYRIIRSPEEAADALLMWRAITENPLRSGRLRLAA